MDYIDIGRNSLGEIRIRSGQLVSVTLQADGSTLVETFGISATLPGRWAVDRQTEQGVEVGGAARAGRSRVL